MAASAPELDYLIPQVIDHPINLLDHRLCEDLHLDTDLNGCKGSPSNLVAGIENRRLARNKLAKCSITTAGLHSTTPILNIQHTVLTREDCLNQLRRTSNGSKIFVEMHCHEVALIGCPMLVNLAFKEALELRQQPILVLLGRLRQI